MLYANGIGPLHSARNKARARSVLNKVDLITLRDMASYDELAGLGVNKPVIKVTADPAFRLEPGRQLLRIPTYREISRLCVCRCASGNMRAVILKR